jgi:phosphoribosylglycinamide formyltransferase-1
MKNIAIFASGSGTNAQAIIEHFLLKEQRPIKLILSNNAHAYALERAKKFNINTFIFTRDDFYNTDKITNLLELNNIDFIVLAGFLWLIPDNLIKKFKNRIINIHPALLPKYGGKGMYGMKVHEAVVKNKETHTGITIHYVDEVYDNGEIIFQAKCNVLPTDTPEMVAQKVHQLEYEHFPKVIEKLIS